MIWFRVQFGINLHKWVFQNGEIALAVEACAISVFFFQKFTHFKQINSKLKLYDYPY